MSGVHNIFIGRTTSTAQAIQRSLRTRSTASARLTRTYSVVPTDAKKITISSWIKLGGGLGTARWLMNGWNGSAAASTAFGISSGDCLTFQFGGASAFDITSTEVLRDPTAWYHVVLIVDTTLAFDFDRVQMYVNGRRLTSFSANNPPGLNTTHQFIINNANNAINGLYNATLFYDGYTADMRVIDGQAVPASTFGQADPVTGQWTAKNFSGTYGTNGFYLDFSDTTSATTLCLDRSGNANNWTANNISVAAGITYDSMTDNPFSAGSTRGNYAVWNPLDSTTNKPTQGNLRAGHNASEATRGTIFQSSGKWYYEFVYDTLGTNSAIGIGNSSASLTAAPGADANGYGLIPNTGNKNNAGSSTAYGATIAINDVIGVAYDLDNGRIWWAKNGVWQASGDPAAGTNAAFTGISGTFAPMFGITAGGTGAGGAVNFGQRPFTYTPPTGFSALHTGNLATPTITRGDDNFGVATYIGNGSTQNVTSLRFQPGLVWTKARDATTNNNLYDVIRGVQNKLLSDANTAQTTAATSLTAFNSNGFSLGSEAPVNALDVNLVGWAWKAGSTVSNTSGSITSQVSANPTAGFSVVNWAGTGANATVGHGLSAVPTLIIVKQIGGTAAWAVLHQSANGGDGGHLGGVSLSSNASFVADATQWNSTKPTSSVFSVGTSTTTNGAASSYIAYCFTAISGYSAIGRYIGNGAADGTFVNCGFKPRLVLYKRVDSVGNWQIMDTAREGTNPEEVELIANSTVAESPSSTVAMDVVATGFKLRNTNADRNASGGAYCFIAFAESPFKYSSAFGVSSSEAPYAYNKTISATTLNYSLRTLAINAGWNQKQPLQSTTTVNAATYVGSSTINAYAFETGTGVFPNGSSLVLVNNGNIFGQGGAGGPTSGGGHGSFNSGGAAGPAIRAQHALTITNNGTVAGGGGGGQSGVNVSYAVYGGSAFAYGGGGGGGRGQNGGAGGAGFSGSGTGGSGTNLAPGGGGAPSDGNAFAGSSGGALGAAGGGSGGAPGNCTLGNANITWLVTGTRIGTLA